MSTSDETTPRHSHGRYEHEHTHAEIPHNHLMRAICSVSECAGFATHDIHPLFDPIKLCCFQRQSAHTGPQCPDGKVMCCLCFGRVGVDMLAVEDDGMKVDVCKPCRAAEDAEMERRGRGRT